MNELGVLPPNEYKRANGFNYTCGFQAGLNQKWTVVSVNRILKNESYTGTLIQGKRRKINYKVKKSHDVGSENWIRVEDAHDAIISKGEFQQVQQLLELDTRTAPSQTTVYPLSGFLRCADCGQNMIRRTVTKNGKKYQYYHCSTYKNGGGCTPHMINSEKLTESVLAAIRHQVTLLVEAEKVLSNAELASGEQIGIKILDSQITALEAELERYSNLKIRLYQDLCDDVVSREEYGEMNTRFAQKIKEAQDKIQEIHEKKQDALKHDGTVKETHYGVFICKRKKNTTPCAYHAVPEKMLMMVAMDQIHHLVSTMCEEEKLVKDMMRGSNLDSARSIKMKENSILFRIQEAEERRLRLYEDYKAEILDEDEYSQLKEHYIAEKQRLEHELQKQRQRALELEKRIKICDVQMERINEETYSGLTLDDERIRQAIIEFRPRLVVIDPIQAYLGSDSDLQIAGRARKLMQRLGMWASVYDCAIVLIGHLNKKEGTKGLYRSLGSIDVVAAARSVLQVERDQKDTDIRIVRQIKNSLAPSDGEIRFSITAEMGFQWLECKSTFVSSEQPKVPEFESKTEKAAYLIKKLLSDGDMRAREIYMRMKDEGISRRTAENTKKELGIRSYRKMRQWYWSIHTGE